mgnify:CR=1 FL=1
MTAAMHPELQRVHELAQQGRLDEALELMHRLAEQGEPESLVTLGNFYWQGGPVAQDPPRGREYFRRASNVGHPLGRFFYTNLLATGVFGERRWALALDRLRETLERRPQRGPQEQRALEVLPCAVGAPSPQLHLAQICEDVTYFGTMPMVIYEDQKDVIRCFVSMVGLRPWMVASCTSCSPSDGRTCSM